MTAARIALADFCDIVQGGRHKLSGNDFVESGFPAYGAGGMNGLLATWEFDEAAVVLSSIGARCGKCFYVDGKWSSLANTQVIRPNPQKADSKFLWYQLNDESRWPRSGTGQPFIKPSDVKRHLVHLPPLPEQRRIAAILDKADALRTKRREALAQLDRLAQSIFVEMFGAPNTGQLWQPGFAIKLEEACDFLSGFAWSSSGFSDDSVGMPVIRIQNVGQTGSKDFVYWRDSFNDRFVIEKGDLLLTLSGSFRVAEWSGPRALLNQRVVKLLPKEGLERRWLLHAMQASIEDVAALGRHALVSNVALADLRSFLIPRATQDEQLKFVSRIDALGVVSRASQAAASELEMLFSSLQTKAFTGQL